MPIILLQMSFLNRRKNIHVAELYSLLRFRTNLDASLLPEVRSDGVVSRRRQIAHVHKQGVR